MWYQWWWTPGKTRTAEGEVLVIVVVFLVRDDLRGLVATSTTTTAATTVDNVATHACVSGRGEAYYRCCYCWCCDGEPASMVPLCRSIIGTTVGASPSATPTDSWVTVVDITAT
jgi:hypothetical protein